MVVNTRVKKKVDWSMGKEDLFTRMEVTMMETGKITKWVEREYIVFDWLKDFVRLKW